MLSPALRDAFDKRHCVLRCLNSVADVLHDLRLTVYAVERGCVVLLTGNKKQAVDSNQRFGLYCEANYQFPGALHSPRKHY